MTDQSAARWHEPTREQLDRAQRLTTTPRRLAYFFDRLDNPLWLPALADEGWFDLEQLPEPAQEDDGTVRIEDWPPASYLARVAQGQAQTAQTIIESIRGTTNPLIQRQLVKAMLLLSPNDTAEFAEDVQRWIRSPYANLLYEGDVTRLAVRLLEANDTSAGEGLALSLLTIIQDDYILGEIVTMLAEPLARAGRNGVTVLIDALDRRVEGKRGFEVLNFRRVSIGPHEQNQHVDATDSLIDGIRDAALAYLHQTADLGLLNNLIARPDALYQRIAYYVAAVLLNDTTSGNWTTSADRDSVLAALSTLATQLVMDHGAMTNPSVRLEYGHLVRALLGQLNIDDVATLTEWLREGPQLSDVVVQRLTDGLDTQAEKDRAVSNFADRWRAERLALFGPDLPAPLQAIADQLSAAGVPAPTHPGLSHVTYPWVSPPSPLSAAEVAAIPVTGLIEWLSGYEPSGYPLIDSPESSLGQRISEDVGVRPSEYAAAAAAFASAAPVYVGGLVTGLRNAIASSAQRAQRGDDQPRLDLAWDAVLELALILAGRPDDGQANAQQPMDSARWLHRDVARLIEAGLTMDASGLTPGRADAVLAVIARLLDSPDPVPSDEVVDAAADDPITRSINSVRGVAMHALIAVAWWWRRHGGTEDSAPPQLTTLLTNHLDPRRDPSAAVRSVYGQHLTSLFAHLPEWTRDHIGSILGSAERSITTNSRSHPAPFVEPVTDIELGRIAFDDYLLANDPYADMWDLLEPYYNQAIQELGQSPRYRRGVQRDTRQKLLDHLLLLMVWGRIDQEDPRIKKKALRSPLAGDAFRNLGFRLQHGPLPDEKTADRLRALWTWWREWASRRAGGDGARAAAMVAGFPRWWHAGKLGTDWEFSELRAVLAIHPAIEAPSIVIQDMENRVDGHETDALDAMEVILEHASPSGQRQYAAGKAEPTLRRLIRHSDPAIRKRTRDLLQTMTRWGMIELAQRIDADAG